MNSFVNAVDGNLTSTGEGSALTLAGKKLTANDVKASDNGKIALNGGVVNVNDVTAESGGSVDITGESATINSITQNGGTVTVGTKTAKITNVALKDTKLDLGAGNKTTIESLTADNSTIAFYLDSDPQNSALLTLTNAPNSTLNAEWLDKDHTLGLVKTLTDNKKAKKTPVQIPFAVVQNPGTVDAFKVGSCPIIRGFGQGELKIKKQEVAKASEVDKTFLNGAASGEYYYAALSALDLNLNAQARLNSALGLGHTMATDMIDSVRASVLANRYGSVQKDAWATYEHNHLKNEGAKANTDRLEAGFTLPVRVSYGTHNVGLSVMTYRAKGQLSSVASSLKSDVTAVSLNDTLFRTNGQYVNLVARFGRIKNTFNYDNDGDTLNTSYTTPFATLSAEVGQRFDLNSFYAIPQVQLQYTYTKGKTTSLGDDVTMTLGANHALLGRLGVLVGKKFALKHVGLDAYATADLIQSFADKQSVNIAGSGNFDWKIKDKSTTPRLGLGVNATFVKNLRGYAQVNTRFGADNARNNEVKLGLSYRF